MMGQGQPCYAGGLSKKIWLTTDYKLKHYLKKCQEKIPREIKGSTKRKINGIFQIS